MLAYSAYQTLSNLTLPAWQGATLVKRELDARPAIGTTPYGRWTRATCELLTLGRLTHRRPPFGIDTVELDGAAIEVVEEAVQATPFCTLLHFRKVHTPEVAQPRVLVIAPMSGHFATLLRGTVRTMLPDHDVYINDWKNPRDVPLMHGRFGFDEYVEHVIDFTTHLGAGTHLFAVCQPSVAALAAVALMAQDEHPAQPASMTLMAGPIDTRINPTRVNVLAQSKPLEWFELNLISVVPPGSAGVYRRVYPGFVQLSAFMSLNLQRHLDAFAELHAERVSGDSVRADAIRTFYREYFAVMDLTAEFYLETVDTVFQRHALPLHDLQVRGRRVDLSAIRRTALFTVEGELDDICAVGQTLAAQDLCDKLRPYLKTHYVQTGVGHYGVFNGKRWEHQIYPRVRAFIHDNEPLPGIVNARAQPIRSSPASADDASALTLVPDG